MSSVAPGTFAELLNQSLRDRGLSQRAFARELGVRQQTVSKWSRGTASPRVVMLRRVAEILRFDSRQLGAALIGESTPSRIERIIDRLAVLDPCQLAEVDRFVIDLERLGQGDGGVAVFADPAADEDARLASLGSTGAS